MHETKTCLIPLHRLLIKIINKSRCCVLRRLRDLQLIKTFPIRNQTRRQIGTMALINIYANSINEYLLKLSFTFGGLQLILGCDFCFMIQFHEHL